MQKAKPYFYTDLFFTAIETGLYWAELYDYDSLESVAIIRAHDETTIRKVEPELFEKAFQVLENNTYKGTIPDSLKERYLRQFKEDDADFDAIDASNLLQIALYNEIVF
jgi:hypothetical protein